MDRTVISELSVREVYESLNEYAAHSREHGQRQRSAKNATPRKFNGHVDFNGALSMAEKGWAKQATLAMNLADSAITRLREERIIPQPTATWDVSGAEVDVARFLGNEPECMLEFPPAERLGRGDTVTLVRTFSAPGNVDADDIEKYGRLIASLVLSIEAMGIPVEVWAEGIVNTSPGRLYQLVKIKGTTDMLHVGQLMFGLAHPAMLRQVGFGTFDDMSLPVAIYDGTAHDKGRGKAGYRKPDERELFPEGTLFFDQPDWDDDPVIFLVEQLKNLNLVPQR
jgi:hypothetical protein